jgi:hypothetical protein
LASSCGFLTSRAEDEWNEEWTSSGDLTHIGAMPKIVKEEIQKYCQEALAKAVGAAEKEVVKDMCNNVKSSWKDVMKFSRAKPRAIQRAIAGQLNEYKKEVLKKEEIWIEKAEEDMMENNLEKALANDGTLTQTEDNESGRSRTEEMVDCIGKRCYLEQYQKKFRSVSIDGRAGPKKCPSCRQFEPALSKALRIEEYVIQQLEEPTDDIFKLLESTSSTAISLDRRLLR